MASIRRRNGRYHVQIRKNGYQTLTHTLSSLSLVRKWAAGVEADMERHLYTTPLSCPNIGVNRLAPVTETNSKNWMERGYCHGYDMPQNRTGG